MARRAEALITTADRPVTTHGLVYYAQYPLIAILALAIAYSSAVGQWLILIYGVVVILRQSDSQQPFIAALFMLVLIPVFTILKLTTFADNVAIYTYELLVVGVVAAIAETRRDNRKPAQLY